MLAAIVPQASDTWFFKVTGPESAMELVADDFRRFVESIQFDEDGPVLSELPAGWRRGGESAMRFATLDVDTPQKQLNISISKLGRQEDWDEEVKMNVNRWRGQLGLASSDAKWADAEPISVASADGPSAWVDLVGAESDTGMMSPPMMDGHPPISPGAGMAQGSAAPTTPSVADVPADPRLKFQRPEGWRDGRMSSMRMAAFNIGPEDSPAELTVIPAGGDLRGNVARWLGQVRGGSVPDDVVDQALANAKKIDVDGRPAQRFLLTGEDSSSGTAIDATIVPLEEGISLFVKMTGPAQTVTEQSDAIASFLESLELNL